MSVEINWQRLLEDEGELNNSIRGWLDRQFKALDLPPYIKDLSVTSFDLGSTGPDITIKHIGDPFYEFYDESPDFSQSSDSETAVGETTENDINDTSAHLGSTITDNGEVESRRTSRLLNHDEALNERNGVDGSLHYFQPHLRSFLSNTRSPIYQAFTPRTHTSDETSNEQRSTTPCEPAEDSRVNDLQFFLEISYSGNMKMGVSATLLLNYPSPNFISLPLKLTVTDVQIGVSAVMAVIGKNVHFSIISDLQHDGERQDIIPSDTVNIVNGIKIGSEIGDEENGSVLRNVGKVEKFLLERIRSIIRDELAWPGWITIEIT